MNEDDLVPLLVVEDRFAFADSSLVLAPDFDVPTGAAWKDFTFFVVVRTADGSQAKFRATASPIHLRVRDPQAKRKGWRLTIVLHGATKPDVPIDSTVLCESAVLARLVGQARP
jgi:hypothetical protein